MTLAELNATDRSGFAGALGWIFEGSPWVAERAWEKRPFATLDALHDAMKSVVAAAPAEEQLALLRAHPDLGAVRLMPDTTDDTARVDDGGRRQVDAGGRHQADDRGRRPAHAGVRPGTHGSVRLQADLHVSRASRREQSGAGLDALTRVERERLLTLNAEYREKFGFPFLYAVKGSTKHDVLKALERRLPAPPDIEYQEALRQVFRIARFRLEEMIS